MEQIAEQHSTANVLYDGGFLEPSQLALELGISARTLYRWHVLRQGPPRVRLGKRVLFRRESVIEWLQGQVEASPRKTGRRLAAQR